MAVTEGKASRRVRRADGRGIGRAVGLVLRASPAFSPRAPRGGRRSRRRAQAAVVASGSERCLGWRQACDS